MPASQKKRKRTISTLSNKSEDNNANTIVTRKTYMTRTANNSKKPMRRKQSSTVKRSTAARSPTYISYPSMSTEKTDGQRGFQISSNNNNKSSPMRSTSNSTTSTTRNKNTTRQIMKRYQEKLNKSNPLKKDDFKLYDSKSKKHSTRHMQKKLSVLFSIFVREYCKKHVNWFYGEINDNKKGFLYERPSSGEYTKISNLSPKEICKIISNPKNENNTYIIKSNSSSQSRNGFYDRFYQYHWYFKSPYSPRDFENDVPLNNSYCLRWQLEASDQFCNGFSLFGAFQSESWWSKHMKNPFNTFKQVSSIQGIGGNHNNVSFQNHYIDNPVQNENTKILLQHLETLIFEQNHNTLYEALLNQIDNIKNRIKNDDDVKIYENINKTNIDEKIAKLRSFLVESYKHPNLYTLPFYK